MKFSNSLPFFFFLFSSLEKRSGEKKVGGDVVRELGGPLAEQGFNHTDLLMSAGSFNQRHYSTAEAALQPT